MLTKFRITYEDNTYLESHDVNYNEKFDHCHALPPHNTKLWKTYDIITDFPMNGDMNSPLFCGVNFKTGVFHINGNDIHPADEEDDSPLTDLTDPQNFNLTDGWELFNNTFYIPVVGRRVYKGFWGEAILPFCGWKRKKGSRTIIKKMFIYPTSAVIIT